MTTGKPGCTFGDTAVTAEMDSALTGRLTPLFRRLALLGSCLITLMAVSAVAAQAASAAPLFEDKTDFITGSNPASVTSNDFNADGNPDLAVANGISDTVSVLLGNGSGGFGTKTDFPAGDSPRSVTSDDFNADGNPDLAVANGLSDDVSVLLGNGSGGFGTKTDFPTGDGPVSVASDDFNADGNPDLVVANAGADTVSALLGNGSGGFGTKIDFATGDTPASVTGNDFNADGNPDLAVANLNSDAVSVLLGNGSGGFGTKTDFPAGDGPTSVASDDFDADGKPDLAVANRNSDTVSVLLGNGSGGFGTKTDFPTGDSPRSVTSNDLNADGKPDLAVANNDSNTVSVLLDNAPTATAAPTSLDFGSQALGTLSSTRTVTLSTPAAAAGYPLVVSQVRTTGAGQDDFIVSTNDCGGESLPPSSSCEVRVRFAPSAAGATTATLELHHNGAFSPLSVPLTGTGRSPAVARINKVKVSGPAEVKKGKGATYEVKISNSGNAPASGVRLRVSGRGVSFNTSVGKIQGGKIRIVKLRLKPKKLGKFKVNFKVTSANAGSKTVKKTVTVRK